MDTSIGDTDGPAQLPRAVAFIDGQNLFHCAREAFDYFHPNYDVKQLSETICGSKNWRLMECRFYTGIPDPRVDKFWYTFWAKKLAHMGRQRIKCTIRNLRYQTSRSLLPDGSTKTELIGHEKGIDVRIALDMVRLTRENFLDVALIFSQDQDLAEAVDEVKKSAREAGRRITVASAFPISDKTTNKRGINGTDWIEITQNLYDKCIDKRDYRPVL